MQKPVAFSFGYIEHECDDVLVSLSNRNEYFSEQFELIEL